MLVKSTDGKDIKISLTNKLFNGTSKSKFQKRIGELLEKKYQFDNIYQEVWISSEKFYLDFFIPNVKLVIECHGLQHIEHIKFFHKTKTQFNKQKSTDERKRKWCIKNNFKLIEIYDQ